MVDKQEWNGEVLIVGDGLVVYNGQFFEFQQDNKPDYLGYYLAQDFDKWFAQQTQKFTFTAIEDISISTDGIFTFRQFDNAIYEPHQVNLVELLLANKGGMESPRMLAKKICQIAQKWGLRPTDDIGIIRLIKSKN